MKLCRFHLDDGRPRVGLTLDDVSVMDFSLAGVERLETLLESEDPLRLVEKLAETTMRSHRVSNVKLLPPIEQHEVWAAGVTYQRSKTARMDESQFSANAYDKVYDAGRPELFFKSLAEKVVPHGQAIGIRNDSRWTVPEPELALVINSHGKVAGCTIGNDVSARDIEGENLLYLPQAKVYHRSCAIGPWVVVAPAEDVARAWTIRMEIARGGLPVFTGETSVGQLKRSFAELAGFLCRSQVFNHGAVLLTGTGIVPPDDFSLAVGDVVRIGISGIGTLENPVVAV
jgi:2-dehydro-3-deoxy-D-arabinonate dehydratase